MDFSIKRVNALFKKELKDISKNFNVLFMAILPVVFCFVYTNLIKTGELAGVYILSLCVGMNLVMVSSFVIAMLIAEEKEKNTLRTLMLSSVSPMEFLLGKAAITLLLSVTVNIIMFFMSGMGAQYLIKYILITTLVVLSMMEIGAAIGLLAENQMSTGTIGMPILMVLLMIPMFASINNTLKKIAEFLPNYNMTLLLQKLLTGKSTGPSSLYSISVLVVWIIIGAVAFGYIYNKKRLD
jgi:ABC-2 type transport system permease protein